jgi:hypothetical protein
MSALVGAKGTEVEKQKGHGAAFGRNQTRKQKMKSF